MDPQSDDFGEPLDPWDDYSKTFSRFEDEYFHRVSYWRAPLASLRDTPLAELFATFVQLFPDHPGEHNTVFYAVKLDQREGDTPMSEKVLFVCHHFEHHFAPDITNLSVFLETFRKALGDEAETCGINILDCFAELLVLECYTPSKEVVALIKEQAGAACHSRDPN
jgi:hypothetical protein